VAKKGIFKKILKGALAIGGAALGIGAIGGVVKGIKAGTGVLASLKGGVGGLRNTADKIKEGAARVLTGTTKQEREQVLAVKKEARDAKDKLEQVDRLIRAGATPEEARATVGLAEEELTSYEGEKVNQAGMFDFLKNKSTLYIALGLVALLIVPKLLKRR
jgi:hypothetical protein